MVRMADLPASSQAGLNALACPVFDDAAFTGPQSLSDARVALVSSAGLMTRHESNVKAGTGDYRVVSDQTPRSEILINHVSVNFDRTGFQRDLNVVLPRQRLQELVDAGVIAGACEASYSFMGASEPEAMHASALQLADELKSQGINTVCLLPV